MCLPAQDTAAGGQVPILSCSVLGARSRTVPGTEKSFMSVLEKEEEKDTGTQAGCFHQ